MPEPPNEGKKLPPKPRIPLQAQHQLALLETRLAAVLPLIFLVCAMIVIVLSFKYPDKAEKIDAGAAITGLIATAAALAKGAT